METADQVRLYFEGLTLDLAARTSNRRQRSRGFPATLRV